MKSRALLIAGSGLIAGLLCLASIVLLRPSGSEGFLSAGMSGSLLSAAAVAAATAAWWTSRRGVKAWLGKPFAMSMRIVIVAYPLFAILVFFVLMVREFLFPSEASPAVFDWTLLPLAIVVVVYVLGVSVCVGAVPATLLEYVLCKGLLKRMEQAGAMP